MTIDIQALNPIYATDSKLEETVLRKLKSKYEMGSSLIGHPIFLEMVGSPDEKTLNAAEKAAKARLLEVYSCYQDIINGFSWKKSNLSTWRGDFLVIKNNQLCHIDVQSEYTHEINDGDNTRKKLREKLKIIYRDAMKQELATLKGVHTLLVDEYSANSVNYRLARIVKECP